MKIYASVEIYLHMFLPQALERASLPDYLTGEVRLLPKWNERYAETSKENR